VVDLVVRHRMVARPGVSAAQPHGAQPNARRSQDILLGMIADKPDVVGMQTQASEGVMLQICTLPLCVPCC